MSANSSITLAVPLAACDDLHFYEPTRGHGLAHDPLGAIVGPRPIGWISTRSADGTLNLAPYSFFSVFNYAPPILAFSSVGFKDTVRNAQQTGEFVWNIVTRDLAEPMNVTSTAVAAEIDEFALAGLDAAPSRVVSVPRVAQSPVSFECRVCDVMQLRAADGSALDTWMVTGEVVGVHITRALLDDGVYVTAAARPIMRGGGTADYFEIGEAAKFRMRRPKAA
ncbi:Asp/Glu/hydantoin racemase [Paraburkholderia ribeironis]|uniref:Asp/Glu/hydantoin racemase n=1 Tax=Paraburkholderia ribeironis TaxID=1247936 RepID=A0A1N7S2I1_9BURK|nr:flavin reductase family protein [Paraburkholderia ribeironis]SIT41544.1 Asp/Glu/hydantoin racemase [Paraburkholderia ribeironis]